MEPVTYEILKKAIKEEVYKVMPIWLIVGSVVLCMLSGILYYVLKKKIDNMFTKEVMHYDRMNKQILYGNQKKFDDTKKLLSELNKNVNSVFKRLMNLKKYQGELSCDQKETLMNEMDSVYSAVTVFVDMFNENVVDIPQNILVKCEELKNKLEIIVDEINKKANDAFETKVVSNTLLSYVENIEEINKQINKLSINYLDNMLKDNEMIEDNCETVDL